MRKPHEAGRIWESTNDGMSTRPHPTRRQAILACVFAALTAVACATLLSAAALAPAPPVLLPFVAATCVACPMFAAWDLPRAIALLRGDRSLARLRRHLARLPETQHPLGL
jgi:hypothetical protein